MNSQHSFDAFQSTIEHALKAIRDDPQHNLAPSHRAAIYSLFGPVDLESTRLRRGSLAIMSVEKVLPIWEREQPQDRWPQQLISRARDILTGVVSKLVGYQEAEAAIDRLSQWLPSVYENNAYKVSLSAQHIVTASVECLFEASGVYHFDMAYIQSTDPEAVLDYTTTDTASWAAGAYCASGSDMDSTSESCKEFWEWWVTEAVPAALTHQEQ